MPKQFLARFGVIFVLFEVWNCVSSVELTFELEDNSKECFFQNITKGDPASLEYQVMLFKGV